jgi:hypothetical protein
VIQPRLVSTVSGPIGKADFRMLSQPGSAISGINKRFIPNNAFQLLPTVHGLFENTEFAIMQSPLCFRNSP